MGLNATDDDDAVCSSIDPDECAVDQAVLYTILVPASTVFACVLFRLFGRRLLDAVAPEGLHHIHVPEEEDFAEDDEEADSRAVVGVARRVSKRASTKSGRRKSRTVAQTAAKLAAGGVSAAEIQARANNTNPMHNDGGDAWSRGVARESERRASVLAAEKHEELKDEVVTSVEGVVSTDVEAGHGDLCVGCLHTPRSSRPPTFTPGARPTHPPTHPPTQRRRAGPRRQEQLASRARRRRRSAPGQCASGRRARKQDYHPYAGRSSAG